MCRDRQASFARPGQKARYCGPCCVGKNMIDVFSKRCKCGNFALFGFHGKKTVCGKCKEDGMENFNVKKCKCGHQMSFGFPGGKAVCCSKCKEDGMVNVKDDMCKCGNFVSFGFLGGRPVCCSKCKEDDMENLNAKRCPGYGGVPCPVVTLLDNNHDYCLACDPDESRRATRRKDEAAFFDFLAKNNVDVAQRDFPVHYRCINTTKKYSLIDGVIIAKDVVVCLELDEDAHEYYDPVCEEARMHDASAELKLAYPDHRIAWIRVNPHIKKNGKRDVSRKAKKVRDERHHEALTLIRDVLRNPQDCIEYVGYQ